MKYKIIVAAICIGFFSLFNACKNNTADSHIRSEKGTLPGGESLQIRSYTLYTGKTELFVEFNPLVASQTSKFTAHLTLLDSSFLPYTEGNVTVRLIQNGKDIKQTVNAPASPGIFSLALQPLQAGIGKLVFDIETKNFTDQFIIDSVQVYADEKSAKAAPIPETGGTDISFFKEQAWKIDFASKLVVKQTIYDVVKTTGEITAAPGEELTIASTSNGIVKFTGSTNVIGAAVRSGQTLFTVTGGEIAFENIDAAKQAARVELDASKVAFDRADELIKDKLITKADYENAKIRYQQAQINVNNIVRNYNSGKKLSSTINGFIKSILVNEGQYVSVGQPLAVITKSQKILLRVNVSLKDAAKINNIQEANFTLLQNKRTYSTKELNATLLAIARTTDAAAPFIPVHFQMNGRPDLLPGSYAEVFLKTTPVENALVIPATALIEEQGFFYAYVQMAAERFQKRELKLGVKDGINVQVISGVAEGERVVTKGAYQIKLSQVGGALPDHDHE